MSALALLLLLLSTVHGALLASSSVQKCTQQSSTASTVLQCSQKLVVTLTLAAGQSLATEQLQFALTCSSEDGVCPCACNYATDASCKCRDLRDSLTLTLAKSPVHATYGLTYVRSFNHWPVEKVQYTSSCADADTAKSPTCGWYDLDGQRVADSQGFCCRCNSGQIFAATTGGAQQRTRAGLDCDYLGNPWIPIFGSPPSSAHCLLYHPLWFAPSHSVPYEGYAVSESVLDFSIALALTVTNGTTGVNVTSALALSPSQPGVASADGRLQASLVGELMPYRALPVLTSQMLLLPTASSLDAALANHPEKWLLLPTSMVTLDGSECDKVGTAFTAFRFQAGGCGRVVGACLGSQIGQLAAADDARMKQGLDPLYYVARYLPKGANNTIRAAGGQYSLALPVMQIQSSIVTVEVAADSVRFTVNAAPGKIVRAQVCAFNDASCGSVAAMNSRGYLRVTLANEGVIAADFTATAGDCNVPVQSMPAQRIALDAKAQADVSFEVYMTSQAAVVGASCTVRVLDSQNKVTDTAVVRFDVNATSVDAQVMSDGTRETLSGSAPAARTCLDKCGSVLNFVCLYLRGCNKELGLGVFIVLGTLCAGWLLVVAVRRGWIVSLAASLCGSNRTAREDAYGKHAQHRSQRSGPHSKRRRPQREDSDDDSLDGRQRVRRQKRERYMRQNKAFAVSSAQLPWDMQDGDSDGSWRIPSASPPGPLSRHAREPPARSGRRREDGRRAEPRSGSRHARASSGRTLRGERAQAAPTLPRARHER